MLSLSHGLIGTVDHDKEQSLFVDGDGEVESGDESDLNPVQKKMSVSNQCSCTFCDPLVVKYIMCAL